MKLQPKYEILVVKNMCYVKNIKKHYDILLPSFQITPLFANSCKSNILPLSFIIMRKKESWFGKLID
jgi:hypothetical protein